MQMICSGAVLRTNDGHPTRIVGTGGCEVFIDGEHRREYERQWAMMRAERERARVVEEKRNLNNARRLAAMDRAEMSVGPIRRAARRLVEIYAVSYALARETVLALLRLAIWCGLIEPIPPEEL